MVSVNIVTGSVSFVTCSIMNHPCFNDLRKSQWPHSGAETTKFGKKILFNLHHLLLSLYCNEDEMSNDNFSIFDDDGRKASNSVRLYM